MRKSIIAVAIAGAALLLAGCSSSTASTSDVRTVGVDEFVAAMTQPDVTVIDVRTPEEFAAGHVDGALNINVEDPGFEAAIAALEPAGAYAVYCRSGRRSLIATDAMSAAGFTNITNLEGGLADLQSAGAPIVTGAPTG